MNKKQTINLNESQFNSLVTKIVKESVKRVLKESLDSNKEHQYNNLAGVQIFGKSEEELNRIQKYIMDNYGVNIRRQPGQSYVYIPFDSSSEGSKMLEYDFCFGGREQFLETLSLLGIQER